MNERTERIPVIREVNKEHKEHLSKYWDKVIEDKPRGTCDRMVSLGKMTKFWEIYLYGSNGQERKDRG